MINKIHNLSKNEFIEVFCNVFENTSWIAEKLYTQKPFKDFDDLSEKILKIFENTDKEKKLKILNSHPNLADKTKIATLTSDSNKEQNSAGLNQCTEEEFNEFKNLNDKYKSKFGFPFILAVKGRDKSEILTNFRKRILSDKKIEFYEAVKQVKQIASLRLKELNNQSPSPIYAAKI